MTRRFHSYAITGCLVLVTIVGAGISRSASAVQEDVAKVEKLYAEGATLFNAGRYDEALDRFKEAYATYPAANLLFNIARCYEALGRVELALSSFRQFVKQPGVDPATKELAERKILDLEEAKKRGLDTAGRPRRSLEGAEAGTAPSDEAQAPSEPIAVSPWQWVSLGVGAVLVAGGVTSMILGFSDANEAQAGRERNPRMGAVEIKDLEDQARVKKLVGYIATGLGGAALVTGGVLLALELIGGESATQEPPKDEPRVAFGLAPLPGGGSASFAWRF